MPVRSTVRRMKKFEAKYDPETIKQAIEKQRQSIIDQQIARQAELEEIENRTKLILGDFGIPTPLYPAYLNFAREIWKVRNKFSGESLKVEADIALYKWVRRQLREDVLVKLRNEIFTLEPPKP